MGWTWPWATRPGAAGARAEAKAGPHGFVALHVQGEAIWTRNDYGGFAREGYMRNPVVHRAVRMIAEAAAAVPLLLYDGSREVERHPLRELLRKPNPRQAGTSFIEALCGYLMMAGNAYVEMVEAPGDLREMHLLRPDRVSIVADAAGWPVAIEHREGSARRRIGLGVGERALHLHLFHPLDDHYGFAPLQAALMALDIHNAAGRWNKALLDNSARPSGALVYAPKEGGNLTDEQYERLRQELDEGYSGVAKAGRPLLLEGGLDWKSMGLTPKDMDFIEAKNAATLCHCWRLTRSDGTVLAFTDHDRTIRFDGVDHEPGTGLSQSEVRQTADLAVDGAEIEAGLSSERINEDDIASGRYDGAKVETFLVNWRSPQEHALIRSAVIGKMTRSDGRFVAELESVARSLDRPIGRFLRRVCDAELGDERCGRDVSGAALRADGAVTAILAGATFAVSGLAGYEPGWFAHGRIVWTGGRLDGVVMAVTDHRTGSDGVVLALPPEARSASIGDAFVVTAGCDKSFATCRKKFANAINFRGFPHIPGNDAAYGYVAEGIAFDGRPLVD